ncbi:hypothetical protein C0989_007744 [Termitomyces sp. Mn162]|nr:hypothetical protein C0989_007744 [Termitomyces sp. Mn162]
MSAVLNAFKLKPYDLEPVFATWTNGPRFEGNPKKDMPVDDWLDKIQAGCEERKIPEEYWHKVAQHFMGSKAKARLDELKAVIVKVHGGKYRWSWKKFKVAMQNMGWGIDVTQKETVQVSKTTGSWWFKRKVNKDATPSSNDAKHPTPSRFTSFRMKSCDENETTTPYSSHSNSPGKSKSNGDVIEATIRPTPRRSSSGFWPVKRNSNDDAAERPPLPPKYSSETEIVRRSTTTTTEAPLWLLNACNALEYITSEHPKAMSIISAILITAGSIPAIPAISAGAGGAVLASGAAHAIGAIAVGLGQALSMSVKNQNQNQNEVQAPSTSH